MYHHRKLTIYPISYRDGVGRKAGKTPSTSKLTGQWSAEEASSDRKIGSGPSLSGAPANIQAATKVNRSCSVVTKLSTRTGCALNGEVEGIVSPRRLTSVWKKWLNAHTGSLGVKADGMDRNTLAETWEIPTSSVSTARWKQEGQRISTQCEIEGNARIGMSDEVIVVMIPKTTQLWGSEGPLLWKMFSYRKGDA